MKKFLKNSICASLSAITLVTSCYTIPYAEASHVVEAEIATRSGEQGDQISPRTEETTWCIRTYNGRVQKRLWSYTRGIWLTDWIDC